MMIYFADCKTILSLSCPYLVLILILYGYLVFNVGLIVRQLRDMLNFTPINQETNSESVKKVLPISAVDFVSGQLRIAIIRGDLSSESKISEPELARIYDVSRGTIREAIGRLESAHLVTRKANVGARVTTLSTRELLNLFLVRESLEGMACRLAAENMSDNDIDALEAIVAQELETGEIVEEGILKQEHSGDKDFHLRVAAEIVS